MRALICYNPFSGKQSFEKNLNYVVKRLKTKYEEVDAFRSLDEKSITTYIKNFGEKYNLIIVAGGDGSLNEAINGLMTLTNRPKLAYIPVGTVNDVGHMLKLKKSIKGVMRIVLDNHSELLDVCKIQNKFFIYAAGVGNFTNVSYDAPSKLKKRLGRMAYFFEAIRELQQDETINLTIETPTAKFSGKYYVMLALNSKRIAGFSIHRKRPTKLNDGIIDLTLVSKRRFRLSIFNLASFFLFGDRAKSGVTSIQVSKVRILSDKELSYNVDGEFAFKTDNVTLEVYQKAIEIIVNKKIKKRYF